MMLSTTAVVVILLLAVPICRSFTCPKPLIQAKAPLLTRLASSTNHNIYEQSRYYEPFAEESRAVHSNNAQGSEPHPLADLLPPQTMWSLAIKGVIPAAALIGWGITPSKYAPVKLVGSALLGTCANVARGVMVSGRQQLAPPVLLGRLRAGDDWDSLVEVGQEFHMSEQALQKAVPSLYAGVLRSIAMHPVPDVHDLWHLRDVRETLRLQPEQLASLHLENVRSAMAQGDTNMTDKALYLGERMLAVPSTGEGSGEGSGEGRAVHSKLCMQLCQELGLSQGELQQKVSAFAAPFYVSILLDLLEKPDNYSGDMILKQRRSLGLSEVTAGGMHLDFYQKKIESLVGAKGKLDEDCRASLGRLRGIMGVSQFEGERALEAVTAPLYRVVVTAAFEDVSELSWGDPKVEDIKERLKEKASDLQLSQAAADNVVRESIRKLCQAELEQVVRALRSAPPGEEAIAVDADSVASALKQVYRLRDVAVTLLQTKGKRIQDSDVSKFFAGVLLGSPSLRMTDDEKAQLYTISLTRAVEGMKLDEESKARLWELRNMLQLSEMSCYKCFVGVIKPLLKQRLEGMMQHGEYGATTVKQLQEDLNVPEEVFLDMGMEVYHGHLVAITDKGVAPNEAQSAALEKMSHALGMTPEQLDTIHDITCQHVYARAVKQSLSDSSDQGSLDELRANLRMSKLGARGVYVRCYQETLVPTLHGIFEEIEGIAEARLSDQDEGSRAADLLKDLYDMVLLSESSGILEDTTAAMAAESVISHTLKGGLREMVGSAVCEATYVFYIKEACYNKGSERLAQAQRLLSKRESLAALLGLTQVHLSELHRGLGTKLYSSLTTSLLEEEASPEVMTQLLALLEATMGLNPVVCNELVLRSKKTFMKGWIDADLSREGELGAKATAIRMKALNLDLDLTHDLAMPDTRRKQLFFAEATAIVGENGNGSREAARPALQSLLGGWGLPEQALFDLYAQLPAVDESDKNDDVERVDVEVVSSGQLVQLNSQAWANKRGRGVGKVDMGTVAGVGTVGAKSHEELEPFVYGDFGLVMPRGKGSKGSKDELDGGSDEDEDERETAVKQAASLALQQAAQVVRLVTGEAGMELSEPEDGEVASAFNEYVKALAVAEKCRADSAGPDELLSAAEAVTAAANALQGLWLACRDEEEARLKQEEGAAEKAKVKASIQALSQELEGLRSAHDICIMGDLIEAQLLLGEAGLDTALWLLEKKGGVAMASGFLEETVQMQLQVALELIKSGQERLSEAQSVREELLVQSEEVRREMLAARDALRAAGISPAACKSLDDGAASRCLGVMRQSLQRDLSAAHVNGVQSTRDRVAVLEAQRAVSIFRVRVNALIGEDMAARRADKQAAAAAAAEAKQLEETRKDTAASSDALAAAVAGALRDASSGLEAMLDDCSPELLARPVVAAALQRFDRQKKIASALKPNGEKALQAAQSLRDTCEDVRQAVSSEMLVAKENEAMRKSLSEKLRDAGAMLQKLQFAAPENEAPKQLVEALAAVRNASAKVEQGQYLSTGGVVEEVEAALASATAVHELMAAAEREAAARDATVLQREQEQRERQDQRRRALRDIAEARKVYTEVTAASRSAGVDIGESAVLCEAAITKAESLSSRDDKKARNIGMEVELLAAAGRALEAAEALEPALKEARLREDLRKKLLEELSQVSACLGQIPPEQGLALKERVDDLRNEVTIAPLPSAFEGSVSAVASEIEMLTASMQQRSREASATTEALRVLARKQWSFENEAKAAGVSDTSPLPQAAKAYQVATQAATEALELGRPEVAKTAAAQAADACDKYGRGLEAARRGKLLRPLAERLRRLQEAQENEAAAERHGFASGVGSSTGSGTDTGKPVAARVGSPELVQQVKDGTADPAKAAEEVGRVEQEASEASKAKLEELSLRIQALRQQLETEDDLVQLQCSEGLVVAEAAMSVAFKVVNGSQGSAAHAMEAVNQVSNALMAAESSVVLFKAAAARQDKFKKEQQLMRTERLAHIAAQAQELAATLESEPGIAPELSEAALEVQQCSEAVTKARGEDSEESVSDAQAALVHARATVEAALKAAFLQRRKEVEQMWEEEVAAEGKRDTAVQANAKATAEANAEAEAETDMQVSSAVSAVELPGVEDEPEPPAIPKPSSTPQVAAPPSPPATVSTASSIDRDGSMRKAESPSSKAKGPLSLSQLVDQAMDALESSTAVTPPTAADGKPKLKLRYKERKDKSYVPLWMRSQTDLEASAAAASGEEQPIPIEPIAQPERSGGLSEDDDCAAADSGADARRPGGD